MLGGCKGSTGPSSVNPETGRPYGLTFPVVTIQDMVEAQRRLIDHLGIEQLLCVVGGSMGGMQALQWVVSYPDRVELAIPIATTARLSAQAIAFDEVGRQAIMADPDWMGGDYYGKAVPHRGLSLARMIGAHHLPVRAVDAPEVRAGAAGQGRVRLRLRHRLPGGELPALPGRELREALRRQLLPLHHQGDGLLRPDPGERLAARRLREACGRASW